MAFGSFERSDEQPMAEINTTPLVDVMLVLLIIFMVTAPLFTHAVKIDLPQAKSQLNPEKPDTILLAIDSAGKIHWNDEVVEEASLVTRFAHAAGSNPQPELHLRADRDTRYEVIARVMALAQNAGLKKLGFVTDPSDVQRKREQR
jgi:biopolymer transport protein ExbD